MYLEHLKLKNLRRCRELELDFTRDGKPRMWTVLIGENGTGKTSILQAIALAAAGTRQASGLAGSNLQHLRDRRTERMLEIEAEFRFGEEGCREPKIHPLLDESPREGLGLRSTVRLKKGANSLTADSVYTMRSSSVTFRLGDPLDLARERGSHLWFVIGYGVHRGLPAAGRVPDLSNPPINRMRPLFDTDSPPISTSFINHFGGGQKARMYSATLKEVLINTGIMPGDMVDLELRGQGGVARASDLLERDRFQQRMGQENVKVPAVALAHGYQSTIAWIADLVGHILLEAKEKVAPDEFEGLVLVDEIDLYLHPTWQARLIPALQKTFPKLQFVCTTHSLAVVGNLAPDEVIRLGVDPSGNVVQFTPDAETGEWDPVNRPEDLHTQPDPRTLTGTELYREFFGMPGRTPFPYGEQLRSYTALATSPERNAYQQQKMEELRRELENANVEQLPDPVGRVVE